MLVTKRWPLISTSYHPIAEYFGVGSALRINLEISL
jgi:hypothetical protein